MSNVWKTVMVIALLAVFLVLVTSPISFAETKIVTPKGIYAQIDVRLTKEAMHALAKGTPVEKQKAIESIKTKPENYAPPVFYLLSNILFQDGKKDEGAFWFYAGQLRARFDANRCADVSARQAVGILNQQYGTPINKYMFQNIPKLEELIPRVVEWDRKTPHNYDHRWINLHGMRAMTSALDTKNSNSTQAVLSLPNEQWDSIAEKTRIDYLSGFKKLMIQTKNKKQLQ